MSYNITLARNAIPSDDKEAWQYLEELQKQETGEQSEDFLYLIERFKEKFPCICDLPDEEIDNGVWSDGPLSNNAGKNLTTLGIVFSAVETVMPFLVKIANENNFVVFDYQSGKISRPKTTANKRGNNKRFETIYKLRFLPFIIAGIGLTATILLKYAFQIEVGKFLGWSIFLTVAAFIYYRGVLQKKNEIEKEEEIIKNPPPPPTKEEIQKMYENKMQGEIRQQQSNIGFRIVYLFISILLILMGLALIISNKEYLFGSIVLVVGILSTIFSIFVLRKWIAYLKVFKEEKKKKVFDDEIDNEN